MKEKTCFKCGITQTVDNFYKHSMMADGYIGKCKTCNKQDVRKNYASKRSQYAEYERRRNQNPKRRAKKLEYQKYRRKRFPEKERARYATTNAIRNGRLIRKPCEKCGAIKVQAHHEDYSKPLEVRWLCFRHHREHHGQVIL